VLSPSNHSLRDNDTRRSDFPANLLSRVVKADAAITVDGITPEGDIKFSVPLRAVGLSRQAMARSLSCRSAFVVNLLGELLVRKNLERFAEMLQKVDPRDYDRIVNNFRHRDFGMMVDQNDVVRFTFHISHVQEILIEDIGVVFRS
jgi:hypothetical protein